MSENNTSYDIMDTAMDYQILEEKFSIRECFDIVINPENYSKNEVKDAQMRLKKAYNEFLEIPRTRLPRW